MCQARERRLLHTHGDSQGRGGNDRDDEGHNRLKNIFFHDDAELPHRQVCLDRQHALSRSSQIQIVALATGLSQGSFVELWYRADDSNLRVVRSLAWDDTINGAPASNSAGDSPPSRSSHANARRLQHLWGIRHSLTEVANAEIEQCVTFWKTPERFLPRNQLSPIASGRLPRACDQFPFARNSGSQTLS